MECKLSERYCLGRRRDREGSACVEFYVLELFRSRESCLLTFSSYISPPLGFCSHLYLRLCSEPEPTASSPFYRRVPYGNSTSLSCTASFMSHKCRNLGWIGVVD